MAVCCSPWERRTLLAPDGVAVAVAVAFVAGDGVVGTLLDGSATFRGPLISETLNGPRVPEE